MNGPQHEVAGFDTEAEYQEHAEDAFAAEQESIDVAETAP